MSGFNPLPIGAFSSSFGSRIYGPALYISRFNPLFIGALSSRRARSRCWGRRIRDFNPLFIGALSSSPEERASGKWSIIPVSIPSLAGLSLQGCWPGKSSKPPF